MPPRVYSGGAGWTISFLVQMVLVTQLVLVTFCLVSLPPQGLPQAVDRGGRGCAQVRPRFRLYGLLDVPEELSLLGELLDVPGPVQG